MNEVPYLFGVYRSGSTAIYNICRVIDGEKAKRSTHDYVKGNHPVIVTYRDFRDCLASQWRASVLSDTEKSFDEETDAFMISPEALYWDERLDFTQVLEDLDKYKVDQEKGRKVLFLRYEEFFDSEKGDLNFDYIFEKLESFREKEIPHLTKEYIRKELNFKKMKSFSKKFKDFKECDSTTQIHGKHLYTGQPGTWKTLIPEECHEALNLYLGEYLRRWNYEF
jgi:hypothetical protein